MKRLFALLALAGAVSFGAPAWAEEKAAEPVVAAVAAPAAPASVALAATTSVATPTPPNKGDNAWVMISAAPVSYTHLDVYKRQTR